jgi:hypothetical protein
MERRPHGIEGQGPTRWRALAGSLLLGLLLFLVYTANGRAIGAGDTIPATLLPLALIRGDGPFLDRFESTLRTTDGRLPGYSTRSRGHIVSRYPLGPALLALPFVWPQVFVKDLVSPQWESDPRLARQCCEPMGKNAAAAIMAIAAVLMVHVLRANRLDRVAVPSVLIVALGSDCWAVASQALWQHGPAVLCLAATLLLLNPANPSRLRLALAGLTAAGLVWCRPIDGVFSVVVAAWVVTHFPRRDRLAFLSPAAFAALALLAYNLWIFGTPSGGYAQIEQQHPSMHGVKGTWTGSFVAGATGTLFSPSHGLFVYSPWVAVALGLLPFASKRLSRGTVERWLLWGLVPYFVLLSKYSCWWAGHSFGPRFWIDASPQFAIAVAVALEWARNRSRAALSMMSVAVVLGVTTQAIGVLCFPSSWHFSPRIADRHHERLWDWNDNELTRCVREGPKARAW